MHRFALIFGLLLVACSNDPVLVLPTTTVAAKPALVALPTLLDNPASWIGRPLILVTPVAFTNGTPLLVPGFYYAGQELRAISSDQPKIWLSGSVDEGIKARLPGGLGYLKLRGQLGPPGAYGPDARYPYQFALSGSEVLPPDMTTLTNLTTNAGALNDVLLKVTGTLLATKDDAILTEQTGDGGVPRNNAHQIKLRGQPDPQIVRQLQTSGDVHYGRVSVTGWWHAGSMTPFTIQSAP